MPTLQVGHLRKREDRSIRTLSSRYTRALLQANLPNALVILLPLYLFIFCCVRSFLFNINAQTLNFSH
jgi:hypothetical protein